MVTHLMIALPNLEKVLKIGWEKKLTLNQEKCHFMVKKE